MDLLAAVFGLGAAAPVLVLAQLSRATLMRARGNLLRAGKVGKALLGAVMVVVAVVIVTGADKPLESWLVQASPDWLTSLTTHF